jgi:uncharacterized linocin/CFP29 family protein
MNQAHDYSPDAGLLVRSAGRWATEQMMRYGVSPESLRPCIDSPDAGIRANALLTRDAWEEFDRSATDAAQERLRAVARLVELGLTHPVPNAMGRTLLTYEKVSDMTPANVSMDPSARTVTGRREFTPTSVPNPVVHKDFDIGIREIEAQRDRGEPLDTSHIRNAGRMVAEGLEDLLINGGPTFAGNAIYGYLTQPQRNTGGFITNGNWGQAAKTGEDILADVIKMITGLNADGYFGPYDLIVPGAASAKLAGDFKANSDKTIEQRLREISVIGDLVFCDRLAVTSVVLVQTTSDVVQLWDGMGVTTVMWDLDGGMRVAFKVMAMQTPVVKSDANGNSGIYHMS